MGEKIELHRVYLNAGGYTSEGVYYGHGKPLYRYHIDGEGWYILRAGDRDAAKRLIRIQHGDDVRFYR